MKRWMAFLLACVLLLSAVPVPVFAEQLDEHEIHEIINETEELVNPLDEEDPDNTSAECAHQYEAVVTEPSCTQGGYTTYTCKLCSHSYQADATQPSDCDLTWVKPVAATCAEEGVKGYYICDQCLEQYWDAEGQDLIVDARDLLTPKVEHKMGPWEDLIASTPDTLGTKIRKCQNCDYNETTEAEDLPETLEIPEVKVTFDALTGKPILSWEKVDDAEVYWIYNCDPLEETRERLEVSEETKYLHETAVAGKEYYYQVIAANEEACSLPCVVDVVVAKCAKPVLKVSRDSVTGKPMATWEPVEGATAYEVYCSTDKKNFNLIATVEETSYLVEDAVVDKTYQYALKAICDVPESAGTMSAPVTHTCDCARPVPVAVPGPNGGIRISWDKVEGGKRYTIYRSDRIDGVYRGLTTISGLSYQDNGAPKNKTSYYKVDVFGASTASFSDYSEAVWATNHTFGAWKTVTPATPETEGWQERTCTRCGEVEGKVAPVLSRVLATPTLTVKNDTRSGKPVLSWNSVKNATKYQVYQVNEETGEKIFLEETTSRSYTHKGAAAGKTHTYTVIAVNNTQCSDYCTAKSILCVCAVPTLQILRDSATGKPIVTWAEVDGAASYEVYYSTNNKNFVQIAVIEETAYLMEDAVVDRTYYFKVKTLGKVPETDSALSGAVSQVCDCARPVISAASGANGGITISWEKVTGGKKYTVYRSTTEDGKYVKLGTTSGLSYTDTKAPKNKISYYKVDVYGASTKSWSDYSLPASAMNHTFTAWKTIIPSTPETEGLQERTCTGCGELQSRITPVLSRVLATPTLTVKNDTNSGKPVLSWNSVKKATKYQIYQVNEETGEKIFLEEISSRTYTHKEAKAGNDYTYSVIAVNSTQCSNYSTGKSIACICARPVLKVTRDSETGKPIISWAEIEGAASYEVYYSTNNKNFYSLAAVEDTSYLVESAVVDKTFYYKVKTVSEVPGTDSNMTGAISHTGDCARPVISAASGVNGGITVSWEKVTGGKKYTVYRSTTEDGKYVKLGTTSGLSYTDTKAPKNKISYYKVDVYGASTKSWSDYSLPASAMNHTFTAWKTIIPSTPETEGLQERTCTGCGELQSRITPVLSRVLATPTLTVKNDTNSGKPVLSWNSVKKATKYQIYQVNEETGEKIFLEEISSRTYTHKEAKAGNDYTYSVIAVNSTQCSNYSTGKSIACICARPVLKVTRDSETGKPIISWAEIEGAASYEVYYSTNNRTFSLLATVEDTSYLVESAVVDKTFYYKVKTVSEVPGTDSNMTGAISHTGDCARPVISAASGANGGITISWEKVTGGKKYTVYRSTTEDGKYVKLSTTSGLSYTDTKAPKNKISYYKVDVYGASTKSFSDYSLPASAMNHTFSAWKTTVPSTPTQEGWQERTCTVCQHVEGKVKPVLTRSLATPVVTANANNTAGKPTLSWASVKNATEYWVYLCNGEGEQDIFLGATTARTYTYSEAEVNKAYAFRVMAVNATACSDFSEKKAVLCKCMAPELQMTNDPISGTPIANWAAVEGADEYALYWSQNETSGYELYAVTSELTMTIDRAAGGKSYYKIRAYHESNELADSELSTAVANICKCQRPVATAGIISDNYNKVTWEKVPGATSYEVYRATEADGEFVKLGTTGYTYYLDSGLPTGHGVYYYQVTAKTSLEGTTSARSETAAATERIEGLLKVYVSPSSQTDNRYPYGNTTEAAVCREISIYLVEALERCGITAITNVQKDMYGRVPESNAWGADLHIPLHTNAFNKSTQGTQVYYKTDAGKKVARAIFNQLAPVVPGTGGDSVRKMTDLYELNKSKATVAYIEAAFHDSASGAKWIIEHKVDIAEAICKGVCDAYGINYIAP